MRVVAGGVLSQLTHYWRCNGDTELQEENKLAVRSKKLSLPLISSRYIRVAVVGTLFQLTAYWRCNGDTELQEENKLAVRSNKPSLPIISSHHIRLAAGGSTVSTYALLEVQWRHRVTRGKQISCPLKQTISPS